MVEQTSKVNHGYLSEGEIIRFLSFSYFSLGKTN